MKTNPEEDSADAPFKPMTTKASEMMLEAMRKLSRKEIEPKEATAIAQLGIAIVQAANAEISFIRATKAIPSMSGFGSKMQFLEPPAG